MRCPTSAPLHVLHAHSTMSVLDGASSIAEYVDYVKKQGLGALGLTEHGLVIGWHEQVTQCHEAGVKPICGCEIYLMPRNSYEFKGKPFKYYHLTLLAQNEVGFANLRDMASRSWGQDRIVKSFGNPKPRVTWEDLEMYSEGIICGSGCIEGPIAKSIIRGEVEEAHRNAAALKSIFGDRLFMEVMPHQVNRNYVEEAIEVEGENGRVYTFAATDTVDTPQGRMTILEAKQKGIREISDAIPERAINGPLSDDLIRRISYADIDDADDPISNIPMTIRRISTAEDNETATT